MSYTSTTDFLALLRKAPDGTMRELSMPGLDFIVAALSRAGLIALWVNPSDGPTVNKSTTAWLKTSASSWATEGTLMLWDVASLTYQPATPALWAALFNATRHVTHSEVDPTVSRAISPDEAGSLFTNAGASLLQLTLPLASLVPNVTYEFLMTQSGSMAVLVNNHGLAGADTMAYGLTISNIGASSQWQGSYLKVRSVGGVWWVIEATGTWTLS